MALGSKKRDYATEHRRVASVLRAHARRMEELMREGMGREEASLRAYKEITREKGERS